MLGETVHSLRITRLIHHRRPGLCETLVGHSSQQEGVARNSSLNLNLPISSFQNGKDHLPGSSATPSRVTNSDTTSFLMLTLVHKCRILYGFGFEVG